MRADRDLSTEEATARLMAKVRVDANGCWVWQGVLYSNGYGEKKVNGVKVLAHRWSYEHFRGHLPRELDHLCRNRACVNPDHLEPVTHKENCLRGTGMSARHAVKTHCAHGHPYDAHNTYRRPKGGRGCLTCRHAIRRAA